MREQKGYIFHKGSSWFVRYCDDIVQTDGTVKRKLVCKKLDVEYGGEYRTRRSVQPFVDDILAPLNAGLLNPQSTMLVSDFVEKIYLKEYVYKNLRPASHKQYRDVWNYYLKNRMGNLTLRGFRTVHGENMLAQIAAQTGLGRSSLRHIKAFLSGAFKQAKRLGILDGLNPIQDVSIPHAPEAEETYAYNLGEIKSMLGVLKEPAWTVVLTAALTGLRKSELRGITWDDFTGTELAVKRSVWNSTVSEPKTNRSKAPIPVVKQLAEALEAHKQRAGRVEASSHQAEGAESVRNLAVGPIFQAGNGKPLNLDNLVKRAILPALGCCTVCKKQEDEHKPEGHVFERNKALPLWHGWHAFRRGLATNLHALGADDKTIQAILRHSNVGLTMNVYVKSVSGSQVSAMDALSEKLGTCNDLATPGEGRPF